MKSKVLSIIALFCGFIIAENAGIDTIVEVENNKKEAAPVKQGWNPDLPLNNASDRTAHSVSFKSK